MQQQSGFDRGVPQAELASIGGKMRAGQWQDAADKLAALRRRYPRDPEVRRLSGIAAHRLGDNNQAVKQLGNALARHPDQALVQTNLGSVLRRSGDPEGALSAFEAALEVAPDTEPALYNLGLLHQQQARLKQARRCFERALEQNPGRLDAWLCLGHARKALGHVDGAAAAYRRGLALKPDSGDLWWALANLKTVAFSDDEVSRMRAQAAREHTRPGLHFALVKALEDRGEHAAAFEHLRHGNQLQRQRVHYNPGAKKQLGDRVISSFNRELIDRHSMSGHPSGAPIFIVSLPRSGSTLVEQILSSHPEVTGASELPDLGQVALSVLGDEAPGAWSPERVRELSAKQLYQLGLEYLRRTERWHQTKRFTDKMPNNFPLAGFIGLILPNARIIDCRRDPRDTALSCYKQLFQHGQNWCYDLNDIAAHYRYYRRLMRHWHDVMPGRVLEVRYERLLEDFETEVQRIVAFCGLNWDARCLDFAANTRVVRTASAAQVRQGLSRGSVGRWRAYRAWLGPVLELGAEYESANFEACRPS